VSPARRKAAAASIEDAEHTAQHVAGVAWALRPLVECALRQEDPDRIIAVAEEFARTADRLRAAVEARRAAA
jgi:hypothetical protein